MYIIVFLYLRAHDNDWRFGILLCLLALYILDSNQREQTTYNRPLRERCLFLLCKNETTMYFEAGWRMVGEER